MELPVALDGAFEVGDDDYIEDADGDGVGDVNEWLIGTDPADSEWAPGSLTVDVPPLNGIILPPHLVRDRQTVSASAN